MTLRFVQLTEKIVRRRCGVYGDCCNRASWSRSNAVDLYSGGVRFESRPRHRFSWFTSVSADECRDSNSLRPQPFPSESSPNSSFISYCTIRRLVVSMSIASLSDAQEKCFMERDAMYSV
jgi:hypothetical protein